MHAWKVEQEEITRSTVGESEQGGGKKDGSSIVRRAFPSPRTRAKERNISG